MGSPIASCLQLDRIGMWVDCAPPPPTTSYILMAKIAQRNTVDLSIPYLVTRRQEPYRELCTACYSGVTIDKHYLAHIVSTPILQYCPGGNCFKTPKCNDSMIG